ncbi:MAG TPA: transcription-repair coupling factor [Candidatus Acidoferrales bacterium]|nr:transcription-repair coupling factor [Candidatus Acidoferrales bacterium]
MILPLLAELLARVGGHPAVRGALDGIRGPERHARLAGLTDPAKAVVIATAAAALGRPLIALVDANDRAESFATPLRYFYRTLTRRPESEVVVIPGLDVLPYEKLSPHPEIATERAVGLWQLSAGLARVAIASAGSALVRYRDAEFYRGLAREIGRDDALGLDDLVTHLARVGYEREEMVEMPGQYAVRGGIVDVFPPDARQPVRIELFGDTVESLREFDAATQRSISPVERVALGPLNESPRPAARLASVGAASQDAELDRPSDPELLLPGWEFRVTANDPAAGSLFDLARDAVVVIDEPAQLDEAAAKFIEHVDQAWREAREQDGGAGTAEPARFFLSATEWQRALDSAPRLELARLALGSEPGLTLPTQPTLGYHGNIAAFMAELRGRLGAGEPVVVSAATSGELERLVDLCREYELPYQLGEWDEGGGVSRLAVDATVDNLAAVVLARAPLAEGVRFLDLKFSFYGCADLFDAAVERPRRRLPAGFSSDFSDLKPGDLVVHVDHGIGEFEGLRQMAVEAGSGEFMLLRYADDARLYVPLARLDLVQKYRTIGEARPPLDRLGGITWTARKARVRRSVDDLAEKLLELYAQRKTAQGHSFSRDTPWQKELEDSFAFEETPDQLRAIEEVKQDLESPLPMDRLLCGDVGYGKTEVAIRAAFKAAADGKQAAVLAPTTVLVYQHYQTFRQRLAAFPVRVEMLSRLVSRREQKRTIEDLETGKIDIVIGTHRLLSRDVRFHDLGLLVVDEEQRFGVSHKERLKQLRKDVDVLTMSATPIPRTLHMSLAGLRDMSAIETAPRGRLSIQTIVAPFEDGLVRRAIEQELARGGQVFFVHNRVQSIPTMAEKVRRLAPQARIVVGHGQMSERQLEEVMLKFVRHEADILVCTTIIENGLDIPRANTIIINRADRFGLAELYQLRGRVGRSDQRAYAYLLVPPAAALSPEARQRLAALKEFSELGAGFRIAALDLELRGAGNLLGREQHGHINAVGFDLYCQMLERAVAALKGEAVRPELRVSLNLGLDIRIPADYIAGENARLRVYKRIAAIGAERDREEVLRELADRFGPPPRSVLNLVEYAALKSQCERLLVSSVERRDHRLAFRFHPETPVRPERLVRLVRGRKGASLDPSGVLWVEWNGKGASPAAFASSALLELESGG